MFEIESDILSTIKPFGHRLFRLLNKTYVFLAGEADLGFDAGRLVAVFGFFVLDCLGAGFAALFCLPRLFFEVANTIFQSKTNKKKHKN